MGAIRVFLACLVLLCAWLTQAQDKPLLYGRNWVAITGKPLGAMAGARMFEEGGNAVDATCAMLGVVCTMFDDVAWGGECQALIYNPHTKKVIGINGLGVAPTGATPEFFKSKKLKYPPHEGALAAVTPGNPGALMVMLAEFGTLSLEQVLGPAMQLAEGYPIDHDLVRKIEKNRDKLKKWSYAKEVFFPQKDGANKAPVPGEIWRQPDLLATLKTLVSAEREARKAGKDRKAAIYAAFDRFYKGDLGAEYARSTQEQGGLITKEDLANWSVKIEEPLSTTYKGITVYKLSQWTQGPALLQALNILENFEVAPLGYNSARYIHLIYQAMNLAFADRDFYYGDPYFPPAEPIETLLSKDYARERAKLISWSSNNPSIGPGDPYKFNGDKNPYENYLKNWNKTAAISKTDRAEFDAAFRSGTTSIQAADKTGWAVSVTPSGGWLPVPIAGKTGMGMSQRMQSFVIDPAENPFNVVAPGKRPRVTLTPTIALSNSAPFLCFSVQGGDTQDQNLLQFFLNVVEFGMNVQEASEAANINSYQMRASFEKHESQPGRITLAEEVPTWVRKELTKMGYTLDFEKKTSGPITAIYFDRKHGAFQGAASDHGDDTGIAW